MELHHDFKFFFFFLLQGGMQLQKAIVSLRFFVFAPGFKSRLS